MKAAVCKEFGPLDNLKVEDVPDLSPGDGEVVIDVKAASVNFPDVLIVQNLYQFKPELPFSPGGEVAGVVREVGAGVDNVKVGDRVMASNLTGGFAEQFISAANRVQPIGEMPFAEAAALNMVYATSYHALKQRAEIKPGETLLVLGAAGGVGSAAVELGKLMGARVIVGVSSEEKVQFCKDLGADDGFVYPRGPLSRDQQKEISNQIKTLTDGKGADVIYDPVGDDYAEPALRGIAWKGRYLVVGFAAGEIPRVPLNLALLKGCQIMGVFYGAFIGIEAETAAQNIRELMDLFMQGKIKPKISARYKLEDAVQALNDMAERKVLGKIVIEP